MDHNLLHAVLYCRQGGTRSAWHSARGEFAAMEAADGKHILTVNSGSSSLKCALFRATTGSVALACSSSIDRIGLADGRFQARDGNGQTIRDDHVALPDHAGALKHTLAWLDTQTGGAQLDAAGHRLVHGGAQFTQPRRVTPEVLAALKPLIPLAPAHLPSELAAIETLAEEYPGLPQIACFDTAFHRQMPWVAQLVGVPRDLLDAGIVRYGFHGLSYEYILGELRRTAGAEAANGRVIIAHLGNGSSMAAVNGGRSMDTTMGFTPLGGLVMSTRPGDLDPGVLLYLLQEKGMTPAALDAMLNTQSGLLGVSGTSSDMRDLLSRTASDPHAAEAVDLYCYIARKELGGLAITLGGLDTLVFTGGIGENAVEIRWRIGTNLGVLGVELDAARNEAGAPVISRDGSRVTVRVMKTNEELMIARHTAAALWGMEGAEHE